MTFRPDIEGLRALAILPVVVFHAYPSALPGGYAGVDVFFVISGFLITSLLLHRLDAGEYSVASFYSARIRRIFPALFVMLAVTAPAAAWLLSPTLLAEHGCMLGATAIFASNLELQSSTDYFATAAELKPLLHTWSLAVEEQYYIAFPLLLALVYRRWRSSIGLVMVVVGLTSLALSIWWLQTNPALAFYSALSRTFELMVGSGLALGQVRRDVSRAVREFGAGLGLCCLALAYQRFSPQTAFPGAAALLPCLGAAMIIWAGVGGCTLVGRMVSARPLRWIGAMSFSLYLWHWPALVFARHWVMGDPNIWQAAAAVTVSIVVAWASLRWVENPLRRASVSDRHVLVAGVTCIVIALSAAWVIAARTWWVKPVDTQSQQLYLGANDSNPHRRRCHGGPDYVIDYSSRCRFGDLSQPARTAVWGDSHGAELALSLGELAGKRFQSVAQITSSSCPPALGVVIFDRPLCAAHNAATLRALSDDVTVERVILVARYKHYLRPAGNTLERGLERSIIALTAAGKDVLLVEPVPTYAYPVPAALASLHRRGKPVESFGKPLQAYQDEQRESLAMVSRLGQLPRVRVLMMKDVLCSSGRCAVVAGGRAMYFDDNHLSLVGTRALVGSAPYLLPQ